MPKFNELADMEFDEVSLVDIPANQHASILIAKRATEEETVPEIYDENDQPIDVSDLQPGDVVVDGEGNMYEWVIDDEEAPVEQELAVVGKSHSFADQVREELSKALDGSDRDAIISKAAEEISKAEARADEAMEIAKAERDLRLEREYVEVAKQYNVPVDEDELGPVLKRMAESLSYEDCSVIHKALTAAGEMIFAEIGTQGAADTQDIYSMVEGLAEGAVSKAFQEADTEVSKAAAIEQLFTENPREYDEYRTRFAR